MLFYAYFVPIVRDIEDENKWLSEVAIALSLYRSKMEISQRTAYCSLIESGYPSRTAAQNRIYVKRT